MEEGRVIKILLSEGGAKCMCYMINNMATISRLNSVVQYDSVLYIAKGMILPPNTTFRDNGIDDGCRIIYLKNEGSSAAKRTFWLSATSDRTESFERRALAQTEGGKQELARLIDLSLMKAELRGGFKRAARLLGSYFGRDEVFDGKTHLDFEDQLEPSTESLPFPIMQ